MTKHRFWIFTACHSGLPLGLRLLNEGYDATMVLIRPEEEMTGKWEVPKTPQEAKKNRDRVDYLNKNGSGLIDKLWAPQAMKQIRKGDRVIFDQIYGWQYGEQLYKQGIKVLGGSKVGYKLETERDKTLNLAKRMGLDLPMQKRFGPNSALKAAEFLESMNNEKLFVLKSDNTAVITLVAESNNDELSQKLKSDSKEIDKDNLILQEKVDGIEYNIETMYCNGVPFLCNIDIEEKRKYNSKSQVQTGCAADLVWPVPIDHPLRERIVAPFDDFAAKYLGTGRLDWSVIHVPKEDKVYALEMCGDRPGYNQFYTLLETLAVPVGEFLADWLDGKYKQDMYEELFSGDYGASLRVMNDEATPDVPMQFDKEDQGHYWLWGVHKKGGKLLTVGGSADEGPGIITASGDNPEGAFAQVREYYRKFHMTSAWFNADFDDKDDTGSILYRYHALKKLDLL